MHDPLGRERQTPSQHCLVQKQEGGHRLVLSRCAHPVVLGEVIEKGPNVALPQLVRVAAAVKHFGPDSIPYPPNARSITPTTPLRAASFQRTFASRIPHPASRTPHPPSRIPHPPPRLPHPAPRIPPPPPLP